MTHNNIKRTYVQTKIIKITKCSFPYMWYRNSIGKTFEVISMMKKDIFVPQDIDKYDCKTIEPPLPEKPELKGWVLSTDYEVISTGTREIQKDFHF